MKTLCEEINRQHLRRVRRYQGTTVAPIFSAGSSLKFNTIALVHTAAHPATNVEKKKVEISQARSIHIHNPMGY